MLDSLLNIILMSYIIAIQARSPLIGRQMREFIDNNILARHIIMIVLIFVLIIMNGTDIQTSGFYTILIYFWFIFMTKVDLQWAMIILGVVLVGYIYETNKKRKNQHLLTDVILSKLEKENIIQKNNQYMKYMIYGAGGITLIGTLLYAYKKYEKFGDTGVMTGGGVRDGFSVVKFLFY